MLRAVKIAMLGILVVGLCSPALFAQAMKDSENDPLFFLRDLPNPNMLIIADTSGSMRQRVQDERTVRGTSASFYRNTYSLDSDHPDSRMKNLKNALSAVVTQIEGINFGLARFNNYTHTYTYMAPFEYTTISKNEYWKKYCYDADYRDNINYDSGDCLYVPACYRAGWYYSGNSTTSYCSSSNAYHSFFYNGKRYRYVSNDRIRKKNTKITVYVRTSRSADPYPGTVVSSSWNGETKDFAMQDVYAYSGSVCNGLYMPTGGDGKPHVSVDVRNEYDDIEATPIDESDNTADLLHATGTWQEEGSFMPMGSTPLGASLYDARDYFRDTIIPRDNPYPKRKRCRKNYVILITDGLETCGGSPNSAASTLFNNYDIKTYVIALALGNTSQADAIADYGDDGQRNNSASAYPANNTDEIVAAIKEIVADISEQIDTLAPPVVNTVYTHPYWDFDPQYSGNNDASEAIMVVPFFQYPIWRGYLLATWLYFIEYNSRIPDDPGTPQDERWITYNFSPYDLWNAGYILSRDMAPIADTNGDTYINSQDNLLSNPGYKTADNRVMYTMEPAGGGYNLVSFNTSLANKVNRLGLNDADVPATWLTAWTADKARRQYNSALELADVVINYVRGKEPVVDENDADGDGNTKDWLRDLNGAIVYQERDWKLGNSVLSVPAVIGPPSGTFKKKFFSRDYLEIGEQTFAEFQEDYKNRPRVVLYGANDGTLHCFALTDISAGDSFGPSNVYSPPRDYIAGEEIWAIVPGDNDVLPKLKWLVFDYQGDGQSDGQLYNNRRNWRDPADPNAKEWYHWYFVDGPTKFANVLVDMTGSGTRTWHTIVLKSEGRGGRYLYALDLTNPFDPEVLWRFPNAAGNDLGNMGLSVSVPAIAYQMTPGGSDYRWVTLFGAGFDPDDNPATEVGQHIYGLDLVDGSVLYDYDQPATADTGSKKSFVVAPAAVLNSNIGLDYTDDKMFIGDTDGNFWRMDFATEQLHNRLSFGDEKQPIIAAASVVHTYGENSWWDVVFVGTGGDTRVDTATEPRHMLVGFFDEAFNTPFLPANPTISPSGSGDNRLPPPIDLMADPSTFNGTPYVFFNAFLDQNERNDAQPSTNVMEQPEYSILQTFFTLFNPGDDPCTIGESRLIEVDHKIDKVAGDVNRTPLPATGSYAGSLALGEGKAGGTYVSDGVVFLANKGKIVMAGNPVPPPPPAGSKIVVNVLSWRVITD